MQLVTLEDLIKRYIHLGPPSAKGFHGVKCAGCNDYKVRGGFKFDDKIVYSCFNCGSESSFVYDPGRSSISRNGRKTLLAFGIPENELNNALGAAAFAKKDQVSDEPPPKPETTFPTEELKLPANTYLITSDESPWCQVAREYLALRKLKATDYPYFVSESPSYLGRVLIPYYYRDKLVYWQGRSLDPSIEPRYKNPVVSKENILFNVNELLRYTEEPLYVTEGPLDALSLGSNAVALTGSSLTEFKIRELARAARHRRVVFVIDKNSRGRSLGEQVLRAGVTNWYVVCFPTGVEDANEALITYGKLWMLQYITDSAVQGMTGQLHLEKHCGT